MNRFGRWGIALLAGPISGPLFLRAEHHWRNGDRILAGLYATVIAQVWILLPTCAPMLSRSLAHGIVWTVRSL